MLINTLLARTFLSRSHLQPLSKTILIVSQRGMKSPPRHNEEDANKINKLDLTAYFEDYMRRRPHNETGYINLAKDTFKHMVERANDQKDCQTLVNAHIQYLGHRSLLPQSYVDKMLMKALEIGCPETMLDVFQNHSELLYHPNPKVIEAYFQFFLTQGYDKLKSFFTAVKGNHLLMLPEYFNATVIE